MKDKAFENVKNQLGPCGIWCGSCVVGNGTLRELTQRYEAIIERYGLAEWAPNDFDFKEFQKGLTSIQAMPVCQGCLKGDGRPDCELRACASSKDLVDCSECDDPMACKHRDTLQKMRTGALRAGILVKTENVDRQALLERWKTEIKRKWPSCLLFLGNQ